MNGRNETTLEGGKLGWGGFRKRMLMLVGEELDYSVCAGGRAQRYGGGMTKEKN